MAKDRSKTPDDEHGAPSKKDHKNASDSEPDSRSESDDRSKKSGRSRSRSRSNRKRSRSRSRSSSRKPRDSDEDSYTSSSESETDSDSYSDSESGRDEDYSESEGERKRRKRRERKRREEKERRRRKEKEKKRRRKEREEKEERKRKKKKEKKKKKKKRDKEKGKKGAVTDLWGKYGIIRETDMWNKRPEFTAWLAEVKQVNLESLPNWEEKQMFKEFMEDHNTATFPSKKYYDLDAYHMRKMEKEVKRGSKYVQVAERTVFNDEEQRRQEMMQERERQKEEQIEALKVSMQSGMAQAMKEQAQLKEEMAYQYKIGNFEAAAAIQRRLDPDVAM